MNLKWDQLDLESATVLLPASGATSDRKLNLSPKLVEMLKALPRRSDFVFTRDDGDPWSVPSYYRRFAKVRDKIAFKRKFDN